MVGYRVGEAAPESTKSTVLCFNAYSDDQPF